jgi:hypothetical protein
MAGTSRITASALFGGLIVLAGAPAIDAQHLRAPVASTPLALAPAPDPSPSGAVYGEIRNDQGQPLPGAVVSIVGASISVAVADDRGRFEFPSLLPGSYQIRAHAPGYLAPKRRAVDVRAGSRTPSTFSLSRPSTVVQPTPSTVLAAGIGAGQASATEPEADASGTPPAAVEASGSSRDGEVTWRLRHARRGVLRAVSLPGDLLAADDSDEAGMFAGFASRAVSSPARFATSLFADMPLTGQFQFLTANSFDAPEDMLTGTSMARGIAFVKLGAPVGDRGDWTVRGAITEADIASWFVAGAYKTRGNARRTHDVGMSYSIQHYVGGNPLALRAVTDGTRNAGTVYGFETLTFTPALTLTYGGRYARYDYLAQRDLISPRAALSFGRADGTRVSLAMSSRADAPGAMEFLPPGEHGLWLPPQRTFSSMDRGGLLRAERSTQVDAGLERAFGATSLAVRGFRQHVDEQMVTVFGVDAPDFPGSRNGHYVVGTVGDVDAVGASIAIRSAVGSRVRGSVAYSLASARMVPAGSLDYVVLGGLPGARGQADRVHDVSASIEADVPETATRVLVFYRIGNGYAFDRDDADPTGLDSLFDVQVRQSLPFLNFTSARWEMLVAIRNFFRDPESDQSIYDELLTVRAPKRLVGGVSLHF